MRWEPIKDYVRQGEDKDILLWEDGYDPCFGYLYDDRNWFNHGTKGYCNPTHFVRIKRPLSTESNLLIRYGWFQTHSGLQLPYKIDCDALSDGTIDELAKVIAWKFAFGRVIGVPTGGLRLARACERYVDRNVDATGRYYPTLIVDDVLTTGASMNEMRSEVNRNEPTVPIGFVIFNRAPCPKWVWPFFTVNEWTQSRATGLG